MAHSAPSDPYSDFLNTLSARRRELKPLLNGIFDSLDLIVGTRKLTAAVEAQEFRDVLETPALEAEEKRAWTEIRENFEQLVRKWGDLEELALQLDTPEISGRKPPVRLDSLIPELTRTRVLLVGVVTDRERTPRDRQNMADDILRALNSVSEATDWLRSRSKSRADDILEELNQIMARLPEPKGAESFQRTHEPQRGSQSGEPFAPNRKSNWLLGFSRRETGLENRSHANQRS